MNRPVGRYGNRMGIVLAYVLLEEHYFGRSSRDDRFGCGRPCVERQIVRNSSEDIIVGFINQKLIGIPGQLCRPVGIGCVYIKHCIIASGRVLNLVFQALCRPDKYKLCLQSLGVISRPDYRNGVSFCSSVPEKLCDSVMLSEPTVPPVSVPPERSRLPASAATVYGISEPFIRKLSA